MARRRANKPIIRFADAHVVVVEKPPGLTTMRHPHEAAEFGPRGRRYLPATLADALPGLLGGGKVLAVHRLDKETSGLVVFARTAAAARHLGLQFREHSVERFYLAIVRGRARSQRMESWLVRDRGDGRRGSATPGEGQHAVAVGADHVAGTVPRAATATAGAKPHGGSVRRRRLRLSGRSLTVR